jgi:shikimate kinase
VISTGGSVIYSEAAMARLKAISMVVFLDARIEAIKEHIQSEAPRGIVGMTAGGLELLYQERRPLYQKFADTVIEIGSETEEEVATKVLTELGPKLRSQ